MKNFFLKALVKLIKPFISTKGAKGKILVVATTALGDTLWTTPSLETLRKNFPNAHIAVLTSPIGLQILQNNPHINELLSYKKPFALLKQRFETILVFHTSQRIILPLCSLLGATRIIGTTGINKGLDSLLTDPVPQTPEHEIIRRLNLTKMIGATPSTEKLSFFLQPEEALPPRENGPWIALHPGSKDGFKRWPYFAELGILLKQMFACEILITGTKEEEPLMRQIASRIPGAHLDNPNRPLREFAALLNQMDLLICNDTGPLHLACALNRPVMGIYTSTNPTLCGPHAAERARVISRRASCTPCLKRKCKLPFCFLQIGPEEVANAVKKFLLCYTKGSNENRTLCQT